MKKQLLLIGVLLFLTNISVVALYTSSDETTILFPVNNARINETTDLPSFFSWRNIDGIDYTTAIKNQNPAPTCEAYALCACLETLMQYQLGKIYYPDLSETHLYFYAGGTIQAGYVHLVKAVNYLKEYGVPDEGCFPDPHRAYDYPFESLPGWQNRTVKLMEWGWVENDEEEIKKALIEHGPLIVMVNFWKDFFYYKEGVYRHRWGLRVGGHMTNIVGYDDNEQCWLCKNSWGTSWGEEGWYKMVYDLTCLQLVMGVKELSCI